jgi:FkbM family methyltransferase
VRLFLLYLYNSKIKIFKRLIPSILRKQIFFSKFQTINIGFCKINLNLENSIDREIYLKGNYEKDKINFLNKISKFSNIDYFLDIGSYIGYYALFFNKIKNVYAFEPNKKTFTILKKNVQINNFNIKIKNFACSSLNTKSKIWYTDENKMGGSSIKMNFDPEIFKYNKKQIKFENVNLRKLDEVLCLRNKNILMKIDVERHELDVLKGAEKLTKNNKITIQIEVHDNLRARVFNYLRRNKFYLINSIGQDYYFKNF